jgi:palmitoyltransferase
MTITFLRLVYVTTFDPPYVPLGRNAYKQKGKARSEKNGIGAGEYDAGDGSGSSAGDLKGPQNDPDSPGLELFYTKDVFVCEGDGRPKWCHECANWKPDRTHHCSSSGRCVKKMDHFCPWVGGPVGENNFKYFIQFTGYTALYCTHLLVVMTIYIHRQVTTNGEDYNRQFAAILALAAFFGMFTTTMTVTSIDLAANNLTQVEKLGAKTREYILAVHMPNTEYPGYINEVQSSWYARITYPLGSGDPSNQAPNRHSTADPNSRIIPVSGSATLQNIGSSQGPPVAPSAGASPVPTGPLTINQPLIQACSIIPSTGPSTLTSAGPSTQPPSGSTRPAAGPAEGGIELPERIDPAGERLSARDLNATRTFGILKTLEPGSNPWDLGSALLNLETVMGLNIIDWILPIRRSPCCNHEDPESHFLIGPAVDILRASYNLIDAKDIRARGGCTPSKRTAVPKFGENGKHAVEVGMRKKYVKQIEKMREGSASEPSASEYNKLFPQQANAPIQLQNLNGHASSQP